MCCTIKKSQKVTVLKVKGNQTYTKTHSYTVSQQIKTIIIKMTVKCQQEIKTEAYVNTWENRNVFSLRLNESTECIDLTSIGSEFQILGAATENALSPYVDVETRGMDKNNCELERRARVGL